MPLLLDTYLLQARTEILAMADVDMLMSSELQRWLQVSANMQEMLLKCR